MVKEEGKKPQRKMQKEKKKTKKYCLSEAPKILRRKVTGQKPNGNTSTNKVKWKIATTHDKRNETH